MTFSAPMTPEPENTVTTTTTTDLLPPTTAPETPRGWKRQPWDPNVRIAAGIAVGLGTYLVVISAANPIGAVIALVAAVAAGYLVIGHPVDKLARAVALALAIRSHGPAAGVEFDRCFPARAKHFLIHIRTGTNPKTTKTAPAAGESRWCRWCDSPEFCGDPEKGQRPHEYTSWVIGPESNPEPTTPGSDHA